MWLGKEHCKATWQPEATIPPSIVREHECGIQLDASIQSVVYGGQTNCTLHVQSDDTLPPKQKKQKVVEKRCSYIQMCILHACITTMKSILLREPVPDIGVYQENDEHILKCNTEKDKERLNERTAGTVYT